MEKGECRAGELFRLKRNESHVLDHQHFSSYRHPFSPAISKARASPPLGRGDRGVRVGSKAFKNCTSRFSIYPNDGDSQVFPRAVASYSANGYRFSCLLINTVPLLGTHDLIFYFFLDEKVTKNQACLHFLTLPNKHLA